MRLRPIFGYLLDESLVGGRVWVDAQRHRAFLAHVRQPLVDMVLGIVDVRELLVAVVVDEVGGGLEIAAELQAGVRAQTAVAHARMIPEPALVQVAVLQRLLGRHSLVRVPGKQRQQQLLRVVVLGDLADHLHAARLERPVVRDVAARRVTGGAHLVGAGRAQDVDDLVDLLERVGGQEEDLAVEELAVDTAHRPHVHAKVVVLGA